MTGTEQQRIAKHVISGALIVAAAAAWGQSPRALLEAHSGEFRQDVIEVTEGVHVAVGFGLANSILVEGEDGLIIVDTMESTGAAEAVLERFREITYKPVAAMVYTHNHYDHVNGAGAFAAGSEPEIFAHALLPQLVADRTNVVRGAIFQRSNRQFGIPLPDDRRINAGIGAKLELGAGTSTRGYIEPTQTFDDTLEVTIAGVEMKLVHTPGETDDQLYVWLPEKRVLMPGDNFYRAFPNLYAIRGTPYRDVRLWIDSLDKMTAEAPEFLVPSHSRPITGAERIHELLTEYRDAINHVYTATLAGMNRGATPDELAHEITLPERFKDNPFVTQFYGTVPWSVRSIYNGHLGWFDGNATNLFPLAPKEEAERMAELAGGVDALREKAQAALDNGDHQWAAELADHLLALNNADDEREINQSKSAGRARRRTSLSQRTKLLPHKRHATRRILKAEPRMDTNQHE
jgi:alkyl sulfatase BDS1-like metallo-beta-lactamase superfamily hydrolase